MGFTPGLTNTFFLLTVLVVLLPAKTYAFGAGDIPDFAYLNDKAFRHGDIENILETLVKSAGGAVIGGSAGGFLGFASSVIKRATGGSKFSKSDVQKVYFGNWLRDYSQAMDIAGLSKLSADTLVLVVAVLGFMTFGFASEEFEVTADRLGVYLPVEHIDNPKGYAEKEGDARSFHPKLRPPVSPRELEIDGRTGMKKYIATENQGWDTSTAFIRRTFHACIEAGRRANGHEGHDLWEAYRLLGTGLHTMEDLLAHSNWCEIALRKMGHKQVFCHVGDRVTVNSPNGPAPPLVTGTFGSADFLHSLLGEAGDKLSQASVTDLSQKMSNASSNGPDISVLKNLFSKFGRGSDDKLNQGEEIKKQSQAYHFDPNNICPPQVQKQLLDLLKWHDDVLRTITKTIEMIPGLNNLLDEFSNDLNEYIYTILAPYLGPILTQATSVLNEGSKAVIDTDDQYEVFNNPNAHDPSHSLLSKDHFGLILNEPAGKIAQIVVENSVNLIVPAWSDNSNPDEIINRILEAFHHPYYATGRSEIQEKMFDHMQSWLGGLGSEANEILNSLTKESVRAHMNKRPGLNDTEEPGYGGCGHGYTPPKQLSGGSFGSNTTSMPNQSYGRIESSTASAYAAGGGYSSQTASAYSNTQSPSHSSSYGRTEASDNYGQGRTNTNTGGYRSQHRDDDDHYRGQTQSKRHDETPKYGNQGRDDTPSYSGQMRDDTPSYGGRTLDDTTAYTGQRHEDTPAYGGNQRRDETPAYGQAAYGGQTAYVGQRNEEARTYGGGQQRDETPAYGGQRHEEISTYTGQEYRSDDDVNGGSGRQTHYAQQSYNAPQTGGYAPSYGQPQPAFGGSTRDDDSRGHGKKSRHDDDSDDDKRYKGDQPSYGGKKKDDSDDERKYKPSEPSYSGGGGYGGGQFDTSNYGKSKMDDSDSDDNRKHHRKHGGRQHDDDDNQPSRGGYGGRDDTFGAERLNIGGGGGQHNSEEDRRNHEGGVGQYGGGRY